MNKPKWLELIWLMSWLSPPIVVAAIISQSFDLNVAVCLAITCLLVFVWLAILIAWSRLTASATKDEH